MAGPNVKGDIAIDRDALVGRNASVTTDISVGNDATVDRQANIHRPRLGTQRTSAINTALDSDSAYHTVVTGTGIKFINLPAVSTDNTMVFGNGTEFRFTNDMADNASNQLHITAGPTGLIGGSILSPGQSALAVCVDASSISPPAASWDFIRFNVTGAGRDPISFTILNGPTITTSSWGLSTDNVYVAQFILPSSHENLPIVRLEDENGHFIIADYFQSDLILNINVSATPDARFAGTLVVA